MLCAYLSSWWILIRTSISKTVICAPRGTFAGLDYDCRTGQEHYGWDSDLSNVHTGILAGPRVILFWSVLSYLCLRHCEFLKTYLKQLLHEESAGKSSGENEWQLNVVLIALSLILLVNLSWKSTVNPHFPSCLVVQDRSWWRKDVSVG